jgi:hypothetical protein
VARLERWWAVMSVDLSAGSLDVSSVDPLEPWWAVVSVDLLAGSLDVSSVDPLER